MRTYIRCDGLLGLLGGTLLLVLWVLGLILSLGLLVLLLLLGSSVLVRLLVLCRECLPFLSKDFSNFTWKRVSLLVARADVPRQTSWEMNKEVADASRRARDSNAPAGPLGRAGVSQLGALAS